MPCDQCRELFERVQEVLARLVHLTKTQLDAFMNRDFADLMRIDRELELTMGEKERAIGALNQHRKEHATEAR